MEGLSHYHRSRTTLHHLKKATSIATQSSLGNRNASSNPIKKINTINEKYVTSLAQPSNVTAIINLSSRVQAALTASGSLQVIGPLNHDNVFEAINEERCFVFQTQHQIPSHPDAIIGCAMVRYIAEDYFSPSKDFRLEMFQRPWKYVHSVMLDPHLQGRGIGRQFFQDVVGILEKAGGGGGGTVVLDCWAENEKLRLFYESCGCRYVATVPEEDWEIAVFVKALS